MPYEYRPYVPQTISEILDLLGSIMLSHPSMEDADFPGRSIDTVFATLNEGLGRVSRQLGKERYAKLFELSNRMRTHFESDPDDTNGEARKGYLLIHEMDKVLKEQLR